MDAFAMNQDGSARDPVAFTNAVRNNPQLLGQLKVKVHLNCRVSRPQHCKHLPQHTTLHMLLSSYLGLFVTTATYLSSLSTIPCLPRMATLPSTLQ